MLSSSALVTGAQLRASQRIIRKISRSAKMSREKLGDYEGLVVPKKDVVRFISECMRKVGATAEDALVIGEHLMIADYRGHFSHGLNRMHMYVKEIDTKLTDPAAKPEVVQDFQATAVVEGNNALGQVIGKFSMNLAIEKADKYGIGIVIARGSNHYGICGYYSLMAMERGMIGFSCTNTSPLMVPTRSTKSALGTNPLSFGMSSGTDEFVLDMATTAVAVGKIELAKRKNTDIPSGWALGHNGQPTTDPVEAFDANLLMPLGGEEKNSGYKGYGLALMVEILCGILGGANFGPNIRKWKEGGKIANLGQCFLVINPEVFVPGAKERLGTLLGQLRGLPSGGGKDVLVAGDPERKAMEMVDKMGGIKYHENQIRNSEQFARQIGVNPMQLVKEQSR